MRTWNNTGYVDAQGTNKSARNVRIFSDLDLFFTRKPSTSDVATLEDVMAIKRSVRNLVLLNHHEKPFHPEIAGGVRQMLFENLTPVVAEVVRKKIEMVIETYEPRAILQSVVCLPKYTQNALEVSITFVIENSPREPQTVELMLERIR